VFGQAPHALIDRLALDAPLLDLRGHHSMRHADLRQQRTASRRRRGQYQQRRRR
jgi:hypothetical protein